MNYSKLLNINPFIEQSNKFDQKLLQIPLKECKEEFILLEKLFKQEKISVVITQNNEAIQYLRKSVAMALLEVAWDLTKSGFILEIKDVYRKPEIQKKKFIKRIDEIKKIYNPNTKEIIYKTKL